MLNEFKREGITIEEYNLIKEVGLPYWHTTIMDKSNVPISGGFGINKDQSRKIAYAEYLERTHFRMIKANSKDVQERWGIDILPTACGFAAGFNQSNTVIRSIGEALERWVMSKWIDDHYYLGEVEPNNELTSENNECSSWFLRQFDDVRLFKKNFLVPFGNQLIPFTVGLTMGLKDKGIFPGSSVQFGSQCDWAHALLESFRHYSILKNGKETGKFPDDKVRFFSSNKEIAINQIERAEKENWPVPQIKLHEVEYFESRNFYLARTIISGWESWHTGPIERFLY